MSIINGMLWALLRRWYGGGFDDKYKWLGNRGLQTAVMITAIFIALIDPKTPVEATARQRRTTTI